MMTLSWMIISALTFFFIFFIMVTSFEFRQVLANYYKMNTVEYFSMFPIDHLYKSCIDVNLTTFLLKVDEGIYTNLQAKCLYELLNDLTSRDINEISYILAHHITTFPELIQIEKFIYLYRYSEQETLFIDEIIECCDLDCRHSLVKFNIQGVRVFTNISFYPYSEDTVGYINQSYEQMKLNLAGDVELNPGPTTYSKENEQMKVIHKLERQVKQLRKLNEKRDNFFQRSLELEKRNRNKARKEQHEAKRYAQGVINAFNNIGTCAQDLAVTLKPTLNAIESMFSEGKEVMAEIRKLLSIPNDLDVVSIFISWLTIGHCIIRKEYTLLTIHLLNFSRFIGISLKDLISLIPTKEVNARAEATAQSDNGFINKMLDSTLFPITSLLAFFVGICSFMCGGCVPNAASVMSNFSLAGRACQGFKNIKDMVCWLFDKVAEIYHTYVYGISKEEYEFCKTYPELEKIYAAVKFIIDIDKNVINTNRDVALQILKVEKTLNDYLSTAHRIGSRANVEMLKGLIQSINSKIVAAQKSQALIDTLRKEPICIYFYGKPGVGKSTLTTVLRAKLFKEYYSGSGTKFEDCYYSRKSTNEFWDGYNQQKIVEYDDFANVKDNINKPNTELGEIISAVNISPYPLHMAELSAKANTYFTSEWILASSNVMLPEIVSLVDKSAVYRRFHICVEVKIDPKYGVDAGGYYKYDAKKATELGNGDILSTKHYTLNLYQMCEDKQTGAISVKYLPDGMNLSFDQLWERILAYQRFSSDHNEKLDQAIRKQAGLEKADKGADVSKILKKFDQIFNYEEFADTMENIDEEFSDASEVLNEDQKLFSGFTQRVSKTKVKETLAKYRSNFKSMIAKVYDKLADTLGLISNKFVVIIRTFLSLMHLIASDVITYITSFSAFGKIALLGTGITLLFTSWFAGFFEFKRVQSTVCQFSFKPDQDTVPCMQCEVCDFIKYPQRGSMLHHYCLKLTEKETRDFLVNKGFVENDLISISQDYLREHINEMNYAQRVYDQQPLVPKQRHFAQRVYDANITKPQLRNYAQRVYDTNVSKPRHVNYAQSDEIVLKTDLYKGDFKYAQRDLVRVEQTTQTLMQNAVWVQAVDENGLANRSNGVFIQGRTMITTAHTVNNEQGRNLVKMVITNPYSTHPSISVPFKDLKITQLKQMDGTLMDVVFVSFPAVVPNRKKILSKFIQSQDIGYLNEGELVMSSFTMHNNRTVIQEKYASKFKYNTKATNYYLHSPGTCPKSQTSCACPIEISNYIDYDLQTFNGMCGGLLSIDNNIIHSKLIGIHVAGGVGAMAMGAILTQELLNNNLNTHIREHDIDSTQLIDGRTPYSQTLVDESQRGKLVEKGDCISLGIAPAPSAPTNTQLNESLVFDKVQQHQTIPAFLRPVKIDDEVIDPMQKGIVKIMSEQHYIDRDILDIAVNDVFNCIGKSVSPQVLTYEEAIKGVENDVYKRSINRTTSPGYPYNLTNTSKGKTAWLGSDQEFIVDNPELRRDVESLIERAKKGQRGDAISIATLKDEKRPIAKVMAGKTRVFEACPQHLVIAIRQYFLDFAAHIMRNRIDNGIAVGINPYSLEWSRVARRLQSKGDFLVAGDFSNFDGSLSLQVLNAIMLKINEWYGGSDEENLIRACLWEHICNADVLVQGEVIRQTHSQPSGNPLTVIINSIFNCVIMRVAYLLLKKEKGMNLRCDYTDFVADIVYGDDDIKSIHCSIIDWFNQDTITETLATIGLTYTDETKTGTFQPYKSLKDVYFLKRKFVLLDDGTFIAPMDVENILEICNWIRGKTFKQSTIENCEQCLKELVLHPKGIYDTYGTKMRNACFEVGLDLKVPTYTEMWQEFLFNRQHYEQVEYEPLY